MAQSYTSALQELQAWAIRMDRKLDDISAVLDRIDSRLDRALALLAPPAFTPMETAWFEGHHGE